MLLEIDTPLYDLMVKLNCDPVLIQIVKEFMLGANYTENGVKITNNNGTPKVEQVAPIKLGVLAQILSNNLPVDGAAFKLARIGIEKAVRQVVLGMGVAGIPAPHISEPDLSTVFKPKATQTTTAFTTVNQVPSAGLIALKDATSLYQPVKGTDAGSKYFVIALNEGVKVAARIKHKGSISIRVEGEAVKSIKNTLKHVGFTDNGTYCSIHMSADSDDLARKAVGAMLFGISIPFNAVTDLLPIWGKGA